MTDLFKSTIRKCTHEMYRYTLKLAHADGREVKSLGFLIRFELDCTSVESEVFLITF